MTGRCQWQWTWTIPMVGLGIQNTVHKSKAFLRAYYLPIFTAFLWWKCDSQPETRKQSLRKQSCTVYKSHRACLRRADTAPSLWTSDGGHLTSCPRYGLWGQRVRIQIPVLVFSNPVTLADLGKPGAIVNQTHIYAALHTMLSLLACPHCMLSPFPSQC